MLALHLASTHHSLKLVSPFGMVGGFSLREAAVAAIALLLGNLRRLNIEHVAHDDPVDEVERRDRGGSRSEARRLRRGLSLRSSLGLGQSRLRGLQRHSYSTCCFIHA